jgi:hypothetical protein
VTALTANHGNMEAAFIELSKSQLKPFLMRIWGPPQGADNDSGDPTKGIKPEGKLLKYIFVPTKRIYIVIPYVELFQRWKWK